jgi:hypothetical protein
MQQGSVTLCTTTRVGVIGAIESHPFMQVRFQGLGIAATGKTYTACHYRCYIMFRLICSYVNRLW